MKTYIPRITSFVRNKANKHQILCQRIDLDLFPNSKQSALTKMDCTIGLENLRLHIPTRTLSCPVTTRTVSKKFPKVSWKFPIKFRALLPLAHFRKGNFSRSEEISKALLPLTQLIMGNFDSWKLVTTYTIWIWNSRFARRMLLMCKWKIKMHMVFHLVEHGCNYMLTKFWHN